MDVRTEESWDDEPERPAAYVDGAWGRTANPNTVDGELHNLDAFGRGLAKLTGPRRTAVRLVVLLILLGIALALIAGVVGIISGW